MARPHGLRCEIDDQAETREPVIWIDDQELSWAAFGRLLLTYAGWGMRVICVPDDRIADQPEIQVREPAGDDRAAEPN